MKTTSTHQTGSHRGLTARIALILTFCFATLAHGSILYSFSTVQGSGGYDPGAVTITSDANVSGPSAADLPDGVVNLQRFFNQDSGGNFELSNVTANTEPTFSDEYLEWTVSAENGFILNPTSLTFNSARGGSSGTRGFAIYGVVNNDPFSEDSLLLHVENETGTRAAPQFRSIDPTGAGFQGADSITFRYNALVSGTSAITIEFDNMALNGMAIPEPSTLALLGLVGIVAVRQLRRRRRA